MTIEALKEELNSSFRIEIGMWTTGLYTRIAPMIPDDTNIICAAEGLDSTSSHSVPIIVTTDNVYIPKYQDTPQTPDLTVLERSDISGIEIDGDFLAQVKLNTMADQYVIERVPLTHAKALMTALS